MLSTDKKSTYFTGKLPLRYLNSASFFPNSTKTMVVRKDKRNR